MNNQEERLQILKMIENGQVTSQEGLRLMDAIGSTSETQTHEITSHNSSPSNHMLKVRVVEPNENVKVNVNIPMALIEVLADVGIKFLPEDRYPELKKLDIRKIIDLIHSGVSGKLVDVQAEGGTVVEVYVEQLYTIK